MSWDEFTVSYTSLCYLNKDHILVHSHVALCSYANTGRTERDRERNIENIANTVEIVQTSYKF